MTVVLRRNEALELNLVEFSDAISLAELKAVAKFQADKPDVLASDCLNVVRACGDFNAISYAELDDLFEYYKMLFAPLRLQIFRRAVWLCEGDGPKGHVNYWLRRDAREGMSSTVKHCHNFDEAAEWLLLNETERDQVARAEDFDQVARFELPPATVRAASR